MGKPGQVCCSANFGRVQCFSGQIPIISSTYLYCLYFNMTFPCYVFFSASAWSWFVDTKLKDWKNLSHLWLLNFTGPVHLLFYEDLQDYLFCELQSVFKFLEYSVNTNTLECAVKNSEGNHHRQKRILRNSGRPVLTLKDIYTEKMIAKINEVSAEVRALLQTFYKRTWNYHMLQDKVL